MSSPCFTLSDGRNIPALGLGTYKLTIEEADDLIKFALLEAGYRHIDGAWIYGNERPIGQAVRSVIDSGKLKRDDIWITSKCWNDKHRQSQVMDSCKESLANFGLDYLDLFLIHWPMGYDNNPESGINKISDVDYLETWKGMEDVYKAGLAKSIGVSNFTVSQLERLLANCSIKPTVNQIEVNPYFSNDDLVDYCKSQGILVTCYSPLANVSRVEIVANHHDLSKDAHLIKIGAKYNKSWAQVALRYNYQRGLSIIPKTKSKQRLIENISIFDFQLTQQDMETIKSINKNVRTITFDATKDHPLYPFER